MKPRTGADPEVADVELGTTFRTSEPGTVRAIRYYSMSSSIGPSVGTLWDVNGRKLASVSFAQKSRAGWQRAALNRPVALRAGETYVVSYSSGGRYADDEGYFAQDKVRRSGPLTATGGVYRYGKGFPGATWHNSSYYADVEFVSGADPEDSSPPSPGIRATSPPLETFPPPRPTLSPIRTPPALTPAARTTTTPAPTPTRDSWGSPCVARPSECGFPDASTTGPTASAHKRVPQDVASGKGWHWDSRGWLEIDGAGAVFSGYRVESTIDVTASGVTISDNVITVGSTSWGISLRHSERVTIRGNSIGGTPSSLCDNAIRDIFGDSDGVTIEDNDIGHCSSGINHFNAGGTITGNYIHDIGFRCADLNPDCGHFNGIQLGAGTGPRMVIDRNTILVPATTTDAIMLANDDGPQRNRLITNNLLAGGGYTVYGSGSETGQASGITVTGNRFSTVYFTLSGSYGPVVHWQPGNTWRDNRWVDGPSAGRLINP